MRYIKYLKEDKIQTALEIPEPKIGEDYAPEKVERYIKMIDDALAEMTKKEENDANDSIIEDLRDKKKKWSNVNKSTKPVKTKQEVPPEQQQGEPPPPQQEPQQKEPQQKESVIRKMLKLF